MPSVGCVGVKPVVLKGFSGGHSLLATRLPGYTSCGTFMTSIITENRPIGRLLSIVDQRILRGSGRRSMASSVVVRVLAVSKRQLPLQLMFSLRRLLPRSHPSAMPLPLLHHRFICPPVIVSPPSEKSHVLSCACSSWLMLRKPVNLTRCLHSQCKIALMSSCHSLL